MNAPFEESYSVHETEVRVLLDVRIPDAAKRLRRERWIWKENADIESVEEDHFVLIIRPGVDGRLAT